jgi:hypothetical protein
MHIAQATGEAFSPQKEHPALKKKNFSLYLWVIFALLDPAPDPATQINADPDPQPCCRAYRHRPVVAYTSP